MISIFESKPFMLRDLSEKNNFLPFGRKLKSGAMPASFQNALSLRQELCQSREEAENQQRENCTTHKNNERPPL